MNLSLLDAAAVLLAVWALCAAWLALRSVRVWQARCESLESSVAALRRELELVASISVRTGRRVQRVEHEYSGVADRVDLVESRGSSAAGSGALDQAIDWARQGADADKLAQQFGLSQGEADLVSRLHGHNKNARTMKQEVSEL